jgi:transcriptional regulator of heat shock response
MEKKLTERQQKILNVAVKEYVETAEPVSSQELLKKHDFGVSPATIRNEMQKLTDKGFLLQPHTSAGRIPTDKGYRFFVNNLLAKEKSSFAKASEDKPAKDLTPAKWEGEKTEDTFKFIQGLTRHLAEQTRALALNYVEDEDIFWKEGWEEVLREPEFEERDNIIDFTKLLENLEQHIGDIKKESGLSVYIGGENSYPKAKNFTVISSHYHLPNGEKGVISIIGPKRMEYDKNINLINSLMKLLDNF